MNEDEMEDKLIEQDIAIEDFKRWFDEDPEGNQKLLLGYMTETFTDEHGFVTTHNQQIIANMKRIANDPSTPRDDENKIRVRVMMREHPEWFQEGEK